MLKESKSNFLKIPDPIKESLNIYEKEIATEVLKIRPILSTKTIAHIPVLSKFIVPVAV